VAELEDAQNLLKDYFDAGTLRNKGELSEKDVFKQIKAMRTPGGINLRGITEYIAKKVVGESLSSQGSPRRFEKDWSPEYDASRRSVKFFSLAEIAEARRLARVFEACHDARDVLNHEAEFRGKPFLAPLIIFWLRVKIKNYCYLYGDNAYPQARFAYFKSHEFEIVVFSLTHGVFHGATIDPNNGRVVWPQGKESPPNPETSINNFPPLTSFMTLVGVPSLVASAKARGE